MKADIVVIGGGPAGLAAGLAAFRRGIRDVVILERGERLGGILNQCIHTGFGLHTFKEELTGPEYAARYTDMVKEAGIPCLTGAMVIDVRPGKIKAVTVVSREKGIFVIEAKAVILAMGCRERPRGALNIPGYRPAGIYAAGTAQQFMNLEGRMPGREAVILGSGDIGLIMARRMTLQGARVKLVAEIKPYSGGLRRNIVQCLDDYGIPLKLSHTVTRIEGKERVQGVLVAQVNDKGVPVAGTEEYVECDTLLISCGLIPENELSLEAGITIDPGTGGPVVNKFLETMEEGIFACGNVLHVHDLVDHVSREGEEAGIYGAEYVKNPHREWGEVKKLKVPEKNKVFLPESRESEKDLICIGCPAGCLLRAERGESGKLIISGNKCSKGKEYAKKEMTAPARGITSYVRVGGGKVLPVKTRTDVPKEKIFECMEVIRRTHVASDVSVGDIVIWNVAGTGVDVVATASFQSLGHM